MIRRAGDVHEEDGQGQGQQKASKNEVGHNLEGGHPGMGMAGGVRNRGHPCPRGRTTGDKDGLMSTHSTNREGGWP